MVPTFAAPQISGRGWRVIAAVICLCVGLPALFLVLREVLPDAEETEEFVRVEVKIIDAKTEMRVEHALVRVYRKVDDRELPDMPPKETFDGTAMLQVRPETAKSSLAYLGIDATGYAPYNASLVGLLETGETIAGDHFIEVALTPE